MKHNIIAIEDAPNRKNSPLKLISTRIDFPLSYEDKNLINIMKDKILFLEGVGLAAPQIGINKSVIAMYIPENAALLRDNAKECPLQVLINAEYIPIEDDGKYGDFEGCYSVKTVYGKVQRYNSIKVKYQNESGEEITKIETGFYARVLQHEIDHLNGILITDRLTSACVQGTPSEMIQLRRDSLSDDKKALLDKLLKHKNILQEE